MTKLRQIAQEKQLDMRGSELRLFEKPDEEYDLLVLGNVRHKGQAHYQRPQMCPCGRCFRFRNALFILAVIPTCLIDG